MLSTLPIILIALAGTPESSAQPGTNASAQNDAPPVGIWPTGRMIDGLLARWCDDTAEKYEFSAEQRSTFGEQVAKRWRRFLKEHRGSLQPLLNEYVEARISVSPPETESVREWAGRAEPLLQLFQEEIVETQSEMAGILTAEQKMKLARSALEAAAGLQLFQAKIKSWRRGEFAEHEWWDPPKRVRRERAAIETAGATNSSATNSAPSAARRRIDEELERWDLFVDEFARVHEFTEGQRRAAESILRECKERVTNHRNHYRARMERLEKLMNGEEGDGSDVRMELVAMYGPVDEIFAELEERLQHIPTAVQAMEAGAPEIVKQDQRASRPSDRKDTQQP